MQHERGVITAYLPDPMWALCIGFEACAKPGQAQIAAAGLSSYPCLQQEAEAAATKASQPSHQLQSFAQSLMTTLVLMAQAQEY